jgi:hypothetical protein
MFERASPANAPLEHPVRARDPAYALLERLFERAPAPPPAPRSISKYSLRPEPRSRVTGPTFVEVPDRGQGSRGRSQVRRGRRRGWPHSDGRPLGVGSLVGTGAHWRGRAHASVCRFGSSGIRFLSESAMSRVRLPRCKMQARRSTQMLACLELASKLTRKPRNGLDHNSTRDQQPRSQVNITPKPWLAFNRSSFIPHTSS